MRFGYPLLISIFTGSVLLSVSGCGSGGGSSPAAPTATVSAVATPTPSPSSAPCSASVIAVPSFRSGVVNGSTVQLPVVQVDWTPVCGVDTASVLEYHVYRDNELVGVTTPHQITFLDPAGTGGVAYYALTTKTAVSPTLFTGSNIQGKNVQIPPITTSPHRYTITVLYKTQQNNTLIYAENNIGTSDLVSLPPPQ